MALSVKKKEGPLFVADLEQLKSVTLSKPKDRIVLGGQLLACSLQPIQALDGLVPQPPRKATKAALAQRGKGKVLNLALEREALALVVRAKVRPVFATDALLKYGLKLKGDEFVVLCAAQASRDTIVTALYFKKGELTGLDEFVLSHPTSHTYEADIHVLLERLRLAHLAAEFHWCGPLAMPRTQTFVQAPVSLWAYALPQALTMSGRSSVLRQHGIAALITILAAVGYGGALWVPYTNYQKAALELSSENSRLQGEYAFASERLNMLRALQAFTHKAEDNVEPLKRFSSVIKVVGEMPGTRVKEARLIWPRAREDEAPTHGKDKDPFDFELLLELEKAEETTALEQSAPLLTRLSDQLGMNLRLSKTDGMRELPAATGKKTLRQYRIQGDFPRAA